jgi:hypothetical protein
MIVKDALTLMEKNPAVGFPWEGTLVGLVNGFIGQASQLDPNTAQAAEIRLAIESLDAGTKDMIYGASLDSVPFPANAPMPSPVPVPLPLPVPSLGPMNATAFHQVMLGGLGFVAAGVTIMMALRGAAAADIVEMFKVLASLLSGN